MKFLAEFGVNWSRKSGPCEMNEFSVMFMRRIAWYVHNHYAKEIKIILFNGNIYLPLKPQPWIFFQAASELHVTNIIAWVADRIFLSHI